MEFAEKESAELLAMLGEDLAPSVQRIQAGLRAAAVPPSYEEQARMLARGDLHGVSLYVWQTRLQAVLLLLDQARAEQSQKERDRS